MSTALLVIAVLAGTYAAAWMLGHLLFDWVTDGPISQRARYTIRRLRKPKVIP